MNVKIKKSAISDIIIFLYFCIILGNALNLVLLNLLTFIAFAFYFLCGAKGIKSMVRSSYFWWLIGFTLFIWLGIIWATSATSAFNMGKTFVKLAIMMLFIYANTKTFEKLIFRMKQFIWATVFMMIKVLLSFASGNTRLNAFSSGTGLHFNSVAQILAFSIILAFWFVLNRKSISSRVTGYIAYIAAAYLMIIWSGSRKSIIMPIVGMLIIIAFGDFGIKKKIRYFIIASLLTLAAIYVILTNDMLSARFVDLFNTMFKGATTDVSEVERKYYRETAAMLFLRSPVIGFGADGFMNYLKQIGYSHLAYCHNNWLEILSAYGIVGGLLYYWYYAYAIARLKKAELVYHRMGVVLFSIVIVLFAFEYGIVTYYFPMYHALLCFVAIFLNISRASQVKDQINAK